MVPQTFEEGLRGLTLGPNHYVIVATRGHKFDDVARLEAARSGAGYVGLLGSERKAVLIFRDLLEQGIPEERVRQIRAPVGLDLGGRQPEDIAVSIMAEILAAKNERAGGPLSMGERLADKYGPGVRPGGLGGRGCDRRGLTTGCGGSRPVWKVRIQTTRTPG